MDTPIKLHLGCGTIILPGWVNSDCAALPGVDVVHDLNKLPLPWKDESADEILCNDVFEHVNFIPLLKECHRILAPGGRIHIQVPHFTAYNNFVDPTHINQFSIKTFNFFVADTYEGKFRGYYFDFKFSRYEKKRITFARGGPLVLWNAPMEWLVNLSPKLQVYFELTGWSRLFPAENIKVTIVK